MKSTTKQQILTNFDYNVLEPVNRDAVRQRTEEIRVQLRRAAQDIWEIGQKLVEVRSRLKHGQFEAWLKAEFGWSHRTAYNFINVYEAFSKPANFAEIEIAASALYLLAAPSTPQAVREHFVQRASSGEKITYKNVQKTLKEQNSKLSPSDTVIQPSENPLPELLSKPEFISQTDAVPTRLGVKAEVGRVQHSSTISESIKPGWYLLERRHLLFCGDTVTTQFSKHMPLAAFAMATPREWHYDWLTHKARAVSVLHASAFTEKLVEQLLLLHSLRGEAVIFPSLPSAIPIAVAHRLGRQIYAGDPDPAHCRGVIEGLGFRAERVSL